MIMNIRRHELKDSGAKIVYAEGYPELDYRLKAAGLQLGFVENREEFFYNVYLINRDLVLCVGRKGRIATPIIPEDITKGSIEDIINYAKGVA